MRNFWSILIAYLVAWAIFFLYSATVGHRLTRIEDQLRRLKDRVVKS